MKVLVVYAHPVEGSFCSFLRDQIVAALTGRGHQVDLLDLYAEDFNPVLSADEHGLHRAGPEQRTAVADQVQRLRQAEALVLLYPTWWGGQPAILKGWIDRVWIEGVAYSFPAGAGRVQPLLTQVKSLSVVTTHGSSKLVNALQGEPGKRVALRGLRAMCGLTTRVRWIACYGMDRADDRQRKRFVNRAQAAMMHLR
jgi:NAD(P)H dehydrogenase (quinone)